MRPKFISDKEIAELDHQIDNDKFIQPDLRDHPAVRELFRAGLWLMWELDKLECAPALAFQFQYTHAYNSFNSEPWAEAELLLKAYMNNTYTIQGDS